MKWILAALLLFSGPAMALDPCYSGSWYNPETAGQGFNLEVYEGLVVAYFYSYDDLNNKQFYVGVGPNSEENPLILDVWETVGTADWPKHSNKIGGFKFDPIDGDNLVVEWGFQLDVDKNGAIPWCLYDHCRGGMHMYRLTNAGACDVADL